VPYHGSPGLRPDLDIKQNPVASADAAHRANSNSKELQVPWTQVNTSGSPLQVQTTFARFTSVAYHHRGKTFKWIVVPSSQKLAFEAIIRQYHQTEIGAKECSQFVNHLSLWIMPESLRAWNIEFFEVTQNVMRSGPI
jgi:hypothetical protein